MLRPDFQILGNHEYPPRQHRRGTVAAMYMGRLELTWTNKNLTLLAHESRTYEWVDPADYRVREARLLHDVTTVGTTVADSKRARDNLLIRGDALHALNALATIPEFSREYLGKVSLCYIDPPFNTGQAFPGFYDDALEHSVWLTMMRDRLLQIREFLAHDGSVWVHLDDTESHQARCVLDEVFGADNFITTVIWNKADSPRNSARHFSVDQDYIHVYAKNAATWRPVRLPRTEAADASYRNPDNDPRGPWTPGDPFANKYYSLGQYEVTGPTGNTFGPPLGRYWRISKKKFEELDRDGRIYWRGGGDARPRIKRFLSEVSDLVPRTIWDHIDVGSNGDSSREMRRLFPGAAVFATPKPEKLLHRVLSIATRPGDIVLDCYAGSGTTAAVAHKMGRRWVTCEWSADTVANFALPRLVKVADGSDKGGITEMVGWLGGGGFRLLDVGPSMFDVVDDRVFLADWATDNSLSEAVAAQLGYAYELDGPFSGRKGNTRLAVVDGLVNRAVIELLIDKMADGESLLVCGTAVDPECRQVLRKLRPGSFAKRVPASILDDYRLRRSERLAMGAALDWAEASKAIEGNIETIRDNPTAIKDVRGVPR
jgi:adenine-specific DNA-methyltransferase